MFALRAGTRPVMSRNAMIAAGVALVLLKLYLTSHIRIVQIEAPHDASNFIEHAKHLLRGRWFGPYSDLTLIKGPAYPMYLAAVQDIGLPVPLANQLLYAIASFVACVAIRPLVRGRAAILFVFAVLLFDPFTFGTFAWVTYRSQLTQSAALLVVACAAAISLRRDARAPVLTGWTVALGCALTVFWLTREESIWLVPCVAFLLIGFAWDGIRRGRASAVRRAWLLAIPVVMVFLAVQVVSTINLRLYGWYTAVEMQSPEFVSAYNSLARIEAPARSFVVVTRDARAIAYRVSPAARELQRGFDVWPGAKWVRISCDNGVVCDDIGSGWFMWAFRDAVSAAGHYSSGADARAYYLRLAHELDAACDSGTIACRKKGGTLAPPVRIADAGMLLSELVKATRIAGTFANFTTAHWPVPPRNAEVERDYLFVTRSIAISEASQAFEGWLVHPALRSLAVTGPGGPDAVATITFKPSPDVEQVLGSTPTIRSDTSLARFTIETQCEQQCVLALSERDGRDVSIPLDAATRDFRLPGSVIYHLDAVARGKNARRDFDDGAKNMVLEFVGRCYQALVPYALGFTVLIVLFRALRAVRRRSFWVLREASVALAVFLSAGFLLSILSVIDAFSFASFNAEYMGGLYPLLLFASATVIVAQAALVRRVVRRSDVSRARWVALGALAVGGTVGLAAFLKTTPEASARPPEAPARPPVASAPHRGHPFSCASGFTSSIGITRGAVDVIGTASARTTTLGTRDALVVKGWASDARGHAPVSGVCLKVDGRTVRGQSVLYGAARPDVAVAFNEPNLADTGYEIRLEPGRLTPGRHAVAVVAVDANGREELVAAEQRIVVQAK